MNEMECLEISQGKYNIQIDVLHIIVNIQELLHM